jgi:hypothetical protein
MYTKIVPQSGSVAHAPPPELSSLPTADRPHHPAIVDHTARSLRAHWKRSWSPCNLLPLVEYLDRHGLHLPIVIWGKRNVHTGSRRLVAARVLGLQKVPCIHRDRLSGDQRRSFKLAAELEEQGRFEIPHCLLGFDTRRVMGSADLRGSGIRQDDV